MREKTIQHNLGIAVRAELENALLAGRSYMAMEGLNQECTIAEIKGIRRDYGFNGDLSFRWKHHG